MPKNEYMLSSKDETRLIQDRMDEMLAELPADVAEDIRTLAKALVKIMSRMRPNSGFGEMSAYELIYKLVDKGLYNLKPKSPDR